VVVCVVMAQNQLAASSAYKPQVEAISPTLPVDNALENEIRHSRDELVQNIHRVDRDITNMDHTIEKLKRKQVGAFWLKDFCSVRFLDFE